MFGVGWRRAMATAIAGLGVMVNAQAVPIAVTGNIALTSDYVARGISQTEGRGVLQGGIDLDWSGLYAGAWASKVDFSGFGIASDLELDLYGGWRPSLGPVALNLGAIYYSYPNADEGRLGIGELDYAEVYAKAGIAASERLSFQGAIAYTPEFTIRTGEAWYVEGQATYAASPSFVASAAIGHQTIEDVTGVFDSLVPPFARTRCATYTTWNIGGTYGLEGFEFDLRWHDNDIGAHHPMVEEVFTLQTSVKGRLVFLVRRTF